MSQKLDAIVVGAGHNGLTCGAYLTKAGLRTLVLERRATVGGATATEEFAPGFHASSFSFVMGHLHPKVISELELYRHGLEHVVVDDVLNPTEDNDCIVFSKDPKKTLGQIARFSRKDAENYPKFFAHLSTTIEMLRRLQLETPIDPTRTDWRSLLRTARFAWRYRKNGKDLYNIIDALSMSANDYVSQWFETDIVKAKFMYWATIGGTTGPYSPGTAFYLVAHLIGQLGLSFAKGGMGNIANAIAASGRSHGMQVRTEAAVRIMIDAAVLPPGALQLIVGNVGDLLDHLTCQDIVSFTGSAATAMKLQTHPAIARESVRFIAERDSLNASILGPDAAPGTPEFDLFIREVVQEMTTKAGQ